MLSGAMQHELKASSLTASYHVKNITYVHEKAIKQKSDDIFFTVYNFQNICASVKTNKPFKSAETTFYFSDALLLMPLALPLFSHSLPPSTT